MDKATPTPSGVAPSDIQSRLRQYLERQNQPPTKEPDGEVKEEETLEDQVTEEEEISSVDEEEQEQPQEVPDGESEEEDEQPNEPADADLPPEFYAKKVKAVVNGEELEITVEEATKGYQRLQDYTRKSQETARVRATLVQEIENYKKGLQMVDQFLSADVQAYSKVDWEALKKADPSKYALLKIEEQEAKERALQVRRELTQAEQQQEQYNLEELREVVSQETAKLVKAIPEWNDPNKQLELKKTWARFGIQHGFTQQELEGIIDHRYLVVLDKAARYDALQQKQKNLGQKKVKAAPKVVKGKESPNVGDRGTQQYKAAASRLMKDKSQASAAELLKYRLKPM